MLTLIDSKNLKRKVKNQIKNLLYIIKTAIHLFKGPSLDKNIYVQPTKQWLRLRLNFSIKIRLYLYLY